MTTAITPTKKLILSAIPVYQNEIPYLADEAVISYLLSEGVDMADAHGILSAISVADEYGLTLS